MLRLILRIHSDYLIFVFLISFCTKCDAAAIISPCHDPVTILYSCINQLLGIIDIKYIEFFPVINLYPKLCGTIIQRDIVDIHVYFSDISIIIHSILCESRFIILLWIQCYLWRLCIIFVVELQTSNICDSSAFLVLTCYYKSLSVITLLWHKLIFISFNPFITFSNHIYRLIVTCQR